MADIVQKKGGACVFCGQLMEDGFECNCDAADNLRKETQAANEIEQLFGATANEYDNRPLPKDIRDAVMRLLRMAAGMVNDDSIISAAVQISPRVKCGISMGKYGIKVEREDKVKKVADGRLIE